MIKEYTGVPENTMPIERFINELVDQNIKVITVAEVMKFAGKVADASEQEKLTSQIVRELENHEALIPQVPGESYVNAEMLFNGAEFLIVPDALEIDNNILIPGHRFVPFMDQELFPSEVKLKEAGARKSQSSREFSASAEEIIRYHLLMGAETLFDFFAAEAEENIANAQSSNNPQLKLSALDMKKFYAETQFSEGDAIVVRVIDYKEGIFEFRLENGKQRKSKAIKAYRQKFENVLAQVTEELLPGMPIIDQLRTVFANECTLMQEPMLSLDEMLMSDSAFDIAFDAEVSTLIKRSEDDDFCDCGHDHHHDGCDCGHEHAHDHSRELPDNVTIGSGEVGTLEEMLEKLYSMLNIVELDALLLDNFKNHDLDFNSFYSRAFGESELKFADSMQEACFFNALEERFEIMLDNYSREHDKESAEIRSLIVEFTMERCQLMSEFASMAEELELKPELFEDLAEVTALLDEALKIVNAPAAIGEDFDFEQFRTGVEDALEKGDEAMSVLRGVLYGND